MDSPGTLTLTHPPKKKHFPKIFLILTPNFPNGKIFCTRLKEPHLIHTLWPIQKKLYPKIYYTYPKKTILSNETVFLTRLKKLILQPTKISYNYQKKQFFQTKNFLSLRKKVKVFHFKCVLSTALLFFIC